VALLGLEARAAGAQVQISNGPHKFLVVLK